MHIPVAIPRHRLETTVGDYLRLVKDFLAPSDAASLLRDLEREFEDYVGCRHAIAVSSARSGLRLLLETLGIPGGSEVLIPAFNLYAVVEQFRGLGLTPRFCDIERDTLNIDPNRAADMVKPETRVLLVTHMFGQSADMSALTELARRCDLILLEDCAHAMGTRAHVLPKVKTMESGDAAGISVESRMVGTLGRAAIFSFSVLKLVTTFGGGMITTNDDDLARALRDSMGGDLTRRPRWSGLRRAMTGAGLDLATRNPFFTLLTWPGLAVMQRLFPSLATRLLTEVPRTSSGEPPVRPTPLHPFQARLGLRQLTRCERIIDRRRQVSCWLRTELSGIKGVRLTAQDCHGRDNGLYFGLLTERAAELSRYLSARGVDGETSEYRNCAALPIYRDLGIDCPVSAGTERTILRLPNHPGLSRADVSRIGRLVRTFLG